MRVETQLLECIRIVFMLLALGYSWMAWRRMRYIGLFYMIVESILSLFVMLALYLGTINARELIWSIGVMMTGLLHFLGVYYIWRALKRFG